MNIHVIIGQRAERYDGEYAPEALEAYSADVLSENSEVILDKLAELKRGDEFENVVLVDVAVDQSALEVIDFRVSVMARPEQRNAKGRMDLHVLFGARKSEPGALCAVAVIDGIGIENGNPRYLLDKREEMLSKGQYDHMSIAVLSVPLEPIMKALRPSRPKLKAEILILHHQQASKLA